VGFQRYLEEQLMYSKKSGENERGLVLVCVLLILGLLSAVAAGTLLSGQLDLRISANLKTRSQAFYIAEAGLHHAWQEIADGDGTNDLAALFDATEITTLFSNAPFGGGSYTVTAEPISGPNPKRLKVISTGCLPPGEPCASGNSKVIIEAQLRGDSLFPCAVCSRESINLAGGTKTDSFDSRTAPYESLNAGTNGDVRSNGTITLWGSTTQVNGAATAGGPVTLSKGATVTGATTLNAPPRVFPAVASCGPPYSSGAGVTGGSYDPATGELRGTEGDAIALSDGSYCFSSIQLTEGSSLTVSGPVILNVTAHSDFAGGEVMNTTADAENLKVLSNLVSSERGIRVSGGNQTYMGIYAPDAKVHILGGGDFFGSIVGGMVVGDGGAKIHYDERFEDNQDGKVTMLTWVELF
jgi:hypothetical protein